MKRLARGVLISVLVAWSVFPVVWLGLSSLKSDAEIIGRPASIVPTDPTLEGYRAIFADPSYVTSFLNSLGIALTATMFSVSLSVVTGYYVRRGVGGRTNLLCTFLSFAYLVPPILLALPLYLLSTRIGGSGLATLAFAHFLYLWPLSYFLIQPRMGEISPSIDEAVMLDGATDFQVLRYLWFPYLRLHLLSTAAIIFALSMSDYVLARYLLSSGSSTLPLQMQAKFDLSVRSWSQICSSGTVAFLVVAVPIAVIVAFLGEQRFGGSRS